MKKKYFIVFSFFILCLCFNNERQLTIHASKNNMEAPKQTYLNELESVDDYYTTFANEDVTGLSHDALLEKLAKIMSKTHRYYTSYDDIKGANAFSDESLTDPSKVVAFYGGIDISNTWQPTNYSDVEAWNREHVWCKSLSGGLYTSVSASTRNAGTDIHQLKPSVQKLNSTRNNLMYGDLNHQGTELLYEHTSGIIHTGNYYTSYAFEPRDEIKGDVSRILMYMYTHYSTQVSNSTSGKNGDLRIENIIYTTNNSSTDAWNLLLHWNEMDKVDEFESKRNEYCASITGVRNPFIDHPEFASMIWNESYDGQGALLDDASTNYLNLISSEVTLHIDETYQITPITNIENASFDYSVENDSIVSVDENGLVKALCEGTSKVNITCDDLTTSLLVNVINENESAYWELVTSNEDLVIGNSYFIAAKEYDVALSNNQKSNNRGQIEISKNENFASINKDVAIITLESGVSESSYALKVKDGYLYAAGENYEDRNYLRTKETLDETGSFNIEILENCSA
ncbi:MAG: endonuclease, partial [Erysipelotrichaceae bacterium]|nr:endonuclease [Erysipelotrichaceae bacterium]